jgi:hypothetical protein
VRRKISAHVDGGLSGGYRVRYPGARTPIGVSGNFLYNTGVLRKRKLCF